MTFEMNFRYRTHRRYWETHVKGQKETAQAQRIPVESRRASRSDQGWQWCDTTAGMSVTELMVSICIMAIISAVAIPSYMTHVQQARVVQQVLPVLRVIEMNVAYFYSLHHRLPGPTDAHAVLEGVDNQNLQVELISGVVKLTIDAPQAESKLQSLDGAILLASPVIQLNKISNWHLTGALADRIGISH
ncbi:hypothetical protein ACFL6N_02455 [Thermodesulfobacteriota bacterium]